MSNGLPGPGGTSFGSEGSFEFGRELLRSINGTIASLDDFFRALAAAQAGGGAPGAKPTGSVVLFALSANTVSFQAPEDLTVLYVCQVSGSIQWLLTIDPGLTYTSAFSQAGNLNTNVIALPGTNIGSGVLPCRFPVPGGSKMYFVNNSGTNACVLVVYEKGF